MKELTFETLIAVFEEVFGRWLFWAMVAAVWFVLFMTHSRIADMGGPIDAVILLLIAAVGAVGAAVLVYTLQSLFKGQKDVGDGASS